MKAIIGATLNAPEADNSGSIGSLIPSRPKLDDGVVLSWTTESS